MTPHEDKSSYISVNLALKDSRNTSESGLLIRLDCSGDGKAIRCFSQREGEPGRRFTYTLQFKEYTPRQLH